MEIDRNRELSSMLGPELEEDTMKVQESIYDSMESGRHIEVGMIKVRMDPELLENQDTI